MTRQKVVILGGVVKEALSEPERMDFPGVGTLEAFNTDGLRSMSRTTAFPATIVAGMMLDGAFRRPGVHAPESLGREPGLLDRLLAELEARGVCCRAEAVVEDEAVAVA